MPLLDKLREQYGVGPLCSELHIAPSTYYHCQQQRHHPDKRSARAQRDDWLKKEIQRVYDENHKVYGVRKVWRQLLREGIRVARCTVARLMAVMGLAGVLRGKKVRTTISRKAVAAGDRVNRQFVAERPDQLWVADFTYVSTCVKLLCCFPECGKCLSDRGLLLLCQLLCGKLLKGCGQSVRVPPLEKDEITGRRFGAVFL